MKLLRRMALAAAALSMIPSAASAQEELELDPGVAWEHPHSGISIPATLGGLPRGKATAFAPDYLNLGFSFRDEGSVDEISLYIYRNTNGGVPVWFEQARRGIEVRDIYANPELVYEIVPYAWPGQEGWMGLRAFYDAPASDYASSTGVALFSIDDWYVKVRATSADRSGASLGLWVDNALRELTLPTPEAAQSEPIPVIECAEKLEFKKKAKDAKTDGASSLVNALLGSIVVEELAEQGDKSESSEPVAWCRDAQLGQAQVAYRADASKDAYLIALGDSGMAVKVAPDAGAALMDTSGSKKAKSYSITVVTDTQRINFVPQNRLPSLQRVLEVINANRRVSAVNTWGEDSAIELNPDAL